MMHVATVSDFPLFPKKFSDSAENFPNFTFSKTFSDFHPPKFLTTFFQSLITHFEIPPISLFQFIFPYFGKCLFPPTFAKFSPDFVKLSCFLHTFVYFVSPYFYMMHLCITQCTYWTPLYVEARMSGLDK